MTDPREAAAHLLRIRDAEASFPGFVALHYPGWTIPDFHRDLALILDALEKGTLTPAYAASLPSISATVATDGATSPSGSARSANPATTANPANPARSARSAGSARSADSPVRKLLLTMPPRHAKSAYASVLFPTWYMLRKPSRFLMSTSYNTQLASGFGRQVRELFNEPLSRQAFPDSEMRADSRSVEEWHTTAGGAAYFIGITGTTSGRAANALTIDDPIKTREDAESVTIRNKVWDTYTSSLVTRLQPDTDGLPPVQLVILTRWHPDDLAGRLMQTEEWRSGEWMHINMPAIRSVEDASADPVLRTELPPEDPRHVADPDDLEGIPRRHRKARPLVRVALWPERFPLAELEKRERLAPRDFASLYQQTPYIEGGNMIRSEWWRFYPADLQPERFASVIIAADTAFKATATSDRSSFGVFGLDTNGDIYLLNMIAQRLEFPDLKRLAVRLNTEWRGRGLRGLYIEDKASGQSLIQELRRETGLSVIPYKVKGDKIARVAAVLPLIEGGRVYLPAQAPWLDEFIAECLAFPSSRSGDDQVDVLSMALDVLARTPVTGEYYDPPPISDLPVSRSPADPLHAAHQWRGWGE